MDIRKLGKYDMVYGEVRQTTGRGALVDIGGDTLCYCPASMTVGDKAYFSVLKIYEDERGLHILLAFDSIIEYGVIAA